MDAQLVVAAGDGCAAALAPFVGVDWRAVPAQDLEWSVWDTLLHVNDDLYFYAGQVLLGDPEDYLCFELRADQHADPARVLAALRVQARLLATVVAAADPGTRGHHVHGVSDPSGFLAMGVVETLVHTYDALRGLDGATTWRPPDALAAPVLDRLFPHAPTATGATPGELLLHLCGRTPLGDLPRLVDWRWHGAPRVR